MDSSTYCPLPFVHPFFDVRGFYSPCCNGNHSENSKHVSQMTAIEWFYSDDMKKLRHDMLNSNKNAMCDHCWKKEDLNIWSARKTHVEYWKNKTIDHNNPVPKYFDLKPSNHCNLACIFCTPGNSDKIINITENLPDNEQPERWQRSIKLWNKVKEAGTFDNSIINYIKNNIEHLELLKFTGGEPFLSKEVLEILKMISDVKPELELKFTTNGTVITKEFYSILYNMKNTSIKVSIDGIEDLYSYIKFPSKWNQFERIFKNSMKNLPNVNFNINCLITNMNLEQLPKIQNWFNTLQQEYKNLKFIIFDPNLTPYDQDTGIYQMDVGTLNRIKQFLIDSDWRVNDTFKKIDDAINNNRHDPSYVKTEFIKHNKIRDCNIASIVEPITKTFFKELNL